MLTSGHRVDSDPGAYLALTLAALFWAGNFIAGRALREDIDPVTLNALRWAICLALFLPFVGGRLRDHWRVVMRERGLIVALGLTGIAGFHTAVYLALRDTTAINALLMLSLAPATIVLGAVLLGDARPDRRQQWGFAVSLIGAVVLISRGTADSIMNLDVNRGDSWMLCGVVLWTAYSLLLRRRPADLPLDVSLGASIVVATFLLVPAAILAGPVEILSLTASSWMAIGYIGIFASLVAFLFWSFGVSRIGAARTGQFVHLMPVFGAVLAIAVLGESISLPQIAGAAFVLAGIILVNRGPKRA